MAWARYPTASMPTKGATDKAMHEYVDNIDAEIDKAVEKILVKFKGMIIYFDNDRTDGLKWVVKVIDGMESKLPVGHVTSMNAGQLQRPASRENGLDQDQDSQEALDGLQ